MNLTDLINLSPGDSLIGLGNRWNGEHVVTHVGRMWRREDGRYFRSVLVLIGRRDRAGTVVQDDATICGRKAY